MAFRIFRSDAARGDDAKIAPNSSFKHVRPQSRNCHTDRLESARARKPGREERRTETERDNNKYGHGNHFLPGGRAYAGANAVEIKKNATFWGLQITILMKRAPNEMAILPQGAVDGLIVRTEIRRI